MSAFRPPCPTCRRPVRLTTRTGVIWWHRSNHRRCPATGDHWATAHTAPLVAT